MGRVRQYIGARYVPLFCGDWSDEVKYEPLSIVQYQGNSYTSRQAVPIGISIENEDYWALTGNYSAQIEAYRAEVQAYNERISSIEDALPIADFSAINTVDGRLDEIESVLPISEFDSVNTIDARFDAIESNSWVNTNRIADDAVTNEKLADNAVNTANIADNAVTSAKIADNAVTSDKIPDDSINSDKIVNDIIFGFQNFQGTVTCPYGYMIIPKNKVQIGIVNNSGLQTYEMTSNVFEYMRKHDNFDIAHNCNFVGPRTIDEMPLRLNGTDYNATYPFDYGAFAFNTDTQEMAKYASGTYLANIPASYDNVFMCSYQLVSDGVAIHNYPEVDYYAPRLAFGWDDDNYFIIWAEGRQLGYPGLLLENIADIGVTLGVQELINFDGGGSVNVCVRDQFGNVAKINEFRDKLLPYPQLRDTSLCFGYKFI